MSGPMKTLEAREIDAVNGAGEAGYELGKKAAEKLGASEEVADAAGRLVSAAEDLAKGLFC